MNYTLNCPKQTPWRGLKYHKLDQSSLQLVAQSDSSFRNNEYFSSQLGNTTILTNDTGQRNILSYAICKLTRFVQCILTAETYAFADCFDSFYTLRNEQSRIVGGLIPVIMLTDCAFLFNIIIRSCNNVARRLKINLFGAKEAYDY